MNKEVWKSIWNNKQGRFSLLLLGFLYLCALFAPFLSPYNVNEQNLKQAFHPPVRLCWFDGKLSYRIYHKTDPALAQHTAIPNTAAPIAWFVHVPTYRLMGIFPCCYKLWGPSEKGPFYLLGSDTLGRDVFSRLLFGARVSLSVGLIGISITLIMGFVLGGLSGYLGGKWDFLCMRLVEFLMAIPGLYLLLALRSTLGARFDSSQSYIMIVVLLSLIGWASTARVIRGMAASLTRRPFVMAAQAMGQSAFKILYKHFLPNLSSYLLVAATLSIPGYILGEAALSFLGLGIQEPSASWGLMLKQTQEDLKVFMLNFWWMLSPGVAIFLTVMAFNLFGDVLRDAIDPKMRLK